MAHIVAVGAGQAGAALVAKLRSGGFDGEITLIGAEPVPPYQRPPLSKAYLLGDMPLERLFLRSESFYAESEIDLRLGEAVTSVDASTKQLTLGRETLGYDQLVFTTGSTPRWLTDAQGGLLSGVYPVRDLADIDRLEPDVRQGSRVLIVGGGYIGLEAAAVCAKRGLHVTLIEAAPRILSRVACEETADYFRDLHIGHGVDLREGVGLDRLNGEERVSGAVLSGGTTLDVDLAIIGIGIDPAIELAEMAGAQVENGIAVDAHGRTTVPDLWAAGDCTSLPYKAGRIRLESVQNAIDQAEIVARNLLGEDVAYDPKPWFWSDQYDVKLQIAGLAQEYSDVVARDAGKARSHWYFNGPDLIAVDAMNDPRAYMIGKRLVEAGKRPDKVVIGDPAGDLKALLKA